MSEKGTSPNGNSEKSNSKEQFVLPPVDDKIKHFVHSRTTLSSIEGIGNVQLKRLRKAGVKSLNSLLQHARTRKGRQDIAMKVNASEQQVLKWVGRADKLRVSGVGPEYSALLEAAGVDTVPELARRNPDNLHSKILEVNESENIVHNPPAKKQVEKWISNAKLLPRAVEY
jgi:predicted flap endonuclease-1-like 5' DNA nuclease